VIPVLLLAAEFIALLVFASIATDGPSAYLGLESGTEASRATGVLAVTPPFVALALAIAHSEYESDGGAYFRPRR
jgi:hypothetical protein